MFDPVELREKKLLITGASGQVAEPVVAALAPGSEVTALARFANAEVRQRIEALGARCVSIDLADPDLSELPRDFDYLLNFAVTRSGDFDVDLAANAEAAGRLMLHCEQAQAVLHLSSTAVYQYAGHSALAESAALGDNHRAMFPTYSICKIAAEAVVRFTARRFGIPLTVVRLSVPYGDNGGWPYYHLLMMQQGIPIDLHPDAPNNYHLIHVRDYLEKIPRLLAAASSEVTTVNLGGSQATSIEDWCAWLAELTGLEPQFRSNPQAFGSLSIDTRRMHELVGPTRVDWREGIRSMVQQLAPELLR